MLRVNRIWRSHSPNVRNIYQPSSNRQGDKKEITLETHKSLPTDSLYYGLQDETLVKRLNEFKKIVEELNLIQYAQNLFNWDRTVNLPTNSIEGRIWQNEVAERIYHELLISRKLSFLLEYLEKSEVFEKLNEIDKVIVKRIRWEYDREKNIPTKLREKSEAAETKAHSVLESARKENNFEKIAPLLEEMILLNQKEAKYIGYKGSPYNALLDSYENNMTTEVLDKLFGEIKKVLIPIIRRIRIKGNMPDSDFLNKSYSDSKLKVLIKDLLEHIGYDLSSGKLDFSSDPYAIRVGPNDTRILSSTDSDLIGVIIYTLHEGGHGLYAQGYAPEIRGTFLAEAPTTSIDESQAKLYGDIICLGRPFWIHYFPKLKKMFPKQLGEIDFEKFYRAINTVDLSSTSYFTEEITSPLHNIIRYEIERDLIEGKIKVKDIPQIWKQKTQDYLAITQTNTIEAIMNEDHWFTGYIGYFPTYVLGILYACQLYATAKREISNLEVLIASGNMKVLRDWLKEKIHKYGSLKTTPELIRGATGEDLNPKYFIEYIVEKYSALYPEIKPAIESQLLQKINIH